PINKAPDYPPPYGTFFLAIDWSHMSDKIPKWRLAAARHYDYTTLQQAEKECRTSPFKALCELDPVAHRRDASPELKEFGFASWTDAVKACNRQRTLHGDTLGYCEADPFVRLRAERRAR